MEADQNDQLELLTLKERVDEAVEEVYHRHGFVIDEEYAPVLVEDKMYQLVSQAVVAKRAERAKVALSKRALVASVFPHVAGPEEFAEQEDPELAEGVYQRLVGQLWRLADDNRTGKLQRRLNSDIGLVLCRTEATPHRTPAVYVTKDISCLLADFTGPQKDKITKQAERFASNLVMAVERLPEHSDKFKRELNAGMKAALGSGAAILQPALEQAAEAEDRVDDDQQQ